MLIYGVCLWGVGIGGGFWIAYSITPFASPMGAAGFWAGALVGLVLAAAALIWLLASVARAHIHKGS
jgi:MATE family multidrug resistance protein